MPLSLQNEVEALFRQKIMEFLAWSKQNWAIKEADREKDDWLRGKSDDYLKGYNAAIEGMSGAFECWNEEFGG